MEPLKLQWEATSTGISGVRSGIAEVHIAANLVDAPQLVRLGKAALGIHG